jgi:Fic family protein
LHGEFAAITQSQKSNSASEYLTNSETYRSAVQNHAYGKNLTTGNRGGLKEKIRQDLGQIETLISKIERLSNEKKVIRHWSQNKKGNCIVAVKQHIHQGSKILGINSATVLKETLFNVCLEERKKPGTNRWSMAVKAAD